VHCALCINDAYRFGGLLAGPHPIVKELPLEYAIEMNRLITLQMQGAIG